MLNIDCQTKDNCKNAGIKCSRCIVTQPFGTNNYTPINKLIKNEFIENYKSLSGKTMKSPDEREKYQKKSKLIKQAFKDEKKIIEEIGLQKTVKSGSINHDGDGYGGDWCVDVKTQSKSKDFKININELDKIRFQAHQHNKKGCLIIKNSQGRKVVVFDSQDFDFKGLV